ncbi:actin-related protein [Amanita muscaria]
MSFRDANIIVIETSRTHIRAGVGLYDLLKTPTIEIPARVGIRRPGEGVDVVEQKSTIKADGASKSRLSTLPQYAVSNVTLKDYLVGTQLDEALASGQDILVSWPFADNDVRDWTQAEVLWKYVIFNQLQRRRTQNESPVLLSIAAGLSRSTYERICQMFFERFNVPGFAVLERPIAQIYAANSLSGVVVDIDEEKTDVTAIYENFVVHHACSTVSIGAKECRHYLAHLLKSNTSVMQTLSPASNPLDQETLHHTLLDLVKQVLDNGLIKVPSDGEAAVAEDEGVTDIAAVVVAGKERAVIESGMKKKLTAKASAAEQARAREIEALDLVTIQFRGQEVTLGKERHRFCEPLFNPSLLNGIPGIPPRTVYEHFWSLQDVVGHTVGLADVDQRQYIWQGLVVTGDITRRVKGIGIALQSRLAPYLSQPDLITDVQPRVIRVLSVPEYYAEYRETGNGCAGFLGSSITAKIVFNDSNGKNYVSKGDYSNKGPHAIIEMTPALL